MRRDIWTRTSHPIEILGHSARERGVLITLARTLELAKPDLRPARVSDVEAVLGLPKEPLRAVGQRPISRFRTVTFRPRRPARGS